MLGDRVGAEAEDAGDFLAASPFGDMRCDLALSLAQARPVAPKSELVCASTMRDATAKAASWPEVRRPNLARIDSLCFRNVP